MNPSLPDVTTDGVWLEEQTERLLAFEVLHMWVTGKPGGITPELLSDKIGMHKGYPSSIIKQVQERYGK